MEHRGRTSASTKILLVDHNTTPPCVYQFDLNQTHLKDIEDIIRTIQAQSSYHNHLFIPLGPLAEINYHNKRVILYEGETVDYDCLLILVPGQYPSEQNNTSEDRYMGVKCLSFALKTDRLKATFAVDSATHSSSEHSYKKTDEYSVYPIPQPTHSLANTVFSAHSRWFVFHL
jgi:NADH dehydrogenase FAD-containing subunit